MNERDEESDTSAATFDTSSSLDVAMRALVQLSSKPTEETLPATGSLVDGRYRIDGELGRGGMGVVFAARHVQTEKPVALKWIRVDHRTLGAPTRALLVARFAREARAAGRLHHPHVVEVYDASCTNDTPYLVMEKLEGETLRARLRRGPLDWDDVHRLVVPAMRGVAAAHERGVIHRDLKPDNIFLAQTSESDIVCPKVLDFGVAALQTQEQDETLTRTGALLGTLAYMPLEQLRGNPEVDPRSDVYALGVVLYECLTGKRPFQATSSAEYGVMLATTRPERPAISVPALRGRREAVLLRALARDPRDRFASVSEFIAEIERPHASPRALRAGTVLAAGFMVVASGWLWQTQRKDQAPQHRPTHAARLEPEATVVPSTAAGRVGEFEQEAPPPPTSDEHPPVTRKRAPRAVRPALVESVISGPQEPRLDLVRHDFDAKDPGRAAVSVPVDTSTRLRREDF